MYWKDKPSKLDVIPQDIDYIFTIDESGISNMKAIRKKIHQGIEINENEKKLTLCGTIMSSKEYRNNLKTSINELKDKYWENGMWTYARKGVLYKEKVHFHANELNSRKKAIRKLVNEGTLESFIEDLSILIEESEFKIISVWIDIVSHISKYWYPQDPYLWGTFLMIERFSMFLESNNATGIVVFESRNKQSDKKLLQLFEIIHKDLLEEVLMFPSFRSTLAVEYIKGVFFNPKLNKDRTMSYIGIELVDLVTSVMSRKFKNRDYIGLDWIMLEKKLVNYPTYSGYGIKKWP